MMRSLAGGRRPIRRMWMWWRRWWAIQPCCVVPRCRAFPICHVPDGGAGGYCAYHAVEEGLLTASEAAGLLGEPVTASLAAAGLAGLITGAEDVEHVRVLDYGPIDEAEGGCCRVCGCTAKKPCAGGCVRVPDPIMSGELCSTCAHRERIAGLVNSAGWKVLAVLRWTRQRLTPASAWTRLAAAVDDSGRKVPTLSSEAVAWDLCAAVERSTVAMFDDWAHVLPAALAVLAQEAHGESGPSDQADLDAWQDNATHGEVLDLLDRTIKQLDGQLEVTGGENLGGRT